MNFDSEDDTREHIRQVSGRLKNVCTELRDRGYWHDDSKLGKDEKPIFDVVTPKLRGLTYGTDAYREALKELGAALRHHYQNNSHHPEHYSNGVSGMDLLDLIEMYCDWAAATTRHADGDLGASIEHNSSRFELGPVLTSIFRNTFTRHGGFCGYHDYMVAWPWPDDGDASWTKETDLGTGQEFRRRPKPNAPIPAPPSVPETADAVAGMAYWPGLETASAPRQDEERSDTGFPLV